MINLLILQRLISNVQNSLASYDLKIQLEAIAVDFNLKDQFGKVISSKENNKINFIFISPTCPTCKTLIKQLHKLKDDVLNEIVFGIARRD